MSSDRNVIIQNTGWEAQTTATKYFNFCTALCIARILRRLQTHDDQCSSRVNFNTSAQRLSDRKFIGTVNTRIIQSTVANTACIIEINKLDMLRALESGRYQSSFSLVGSIRISAFAKHNQALSQARRLLRSRSRFVTFILQDWKNIMSEDISHFDDCKLINAKLYLNSECYSYNDLNLDFENVQFYTTCTRVFASATTEYEYLEPNLIFTTFLYNGPFNHQLLSTMNQLRVTCN